MEFDPVLMARIQFAFVMAFHIIFPSFTIGLAPWLVVLEARWLLPQEPNYKSLYQFWQHIFAVATGDGTFERHIAFVDHKIEILAGVHHQRLDLHVRGERRSLPNQGVVPPIVPHERFRPVKIFVHHSLSDHLVRGQH